MSLQEPASGLYGLRARRARLRRTLQALAGVSAMLLCGWAGHSLSEQRGLEMLRQESRHKLDLFAAAVQGSVRRLEHVPGTVQLNPDVLALLRHPQDGSLVQRVNAHLLRLNGHVGSQRVFVLDERGMVLASSDANLGPRSLVGADLTFRPYFLEALSGRVGRHFAIGAVDGEPGYFVSHPIHDGARVVGVATIKIGLGGLDDTWAMLGAPALVADSQRVVILSSEAGWRYTALTRLSDEQRVDIQLARLYGEEALPPFPVALPDSLLDDGPEQEGQIGLPGEVGRPAVPRKALALVRALDGMDWRVLVFVDLKTVRAQAFSHALLASLGAGCLWLLSVLVQQRRRILRHKLEARQILENANADLERQVARRTAALHQTNERLRSEVREREQAELHLRETQDELVHAGKMAVLGQLATSITHELSQPLGGIRTLSGNASEFLRRGELAVVAQNLDLVAQLADQMGHIVGPLKGYARKSAAHAQAVDLALAVRGALLLFEQRLRRAQVRLIHDDLPGTHQAWCDANRLQQVLVNLIGNALDAMADSPVRELRLCAGIGQRPGEAHSPSLEGWAWLRVEDSGPGLSEQQRQHLFEPFFTTKEVGSGLGLGLAISRDIVREFGGDLTADNRPEGGACFLIRMPCVAAAPTAEASEASEASETSATIPLPLHPSDPDAP
ncbi:MAG TPA: ATP-binding protein [Burkholderiaceae bacterium]|nr:ATP-binding protein [Burkholderiaceae bacterium]